LATAGEKGAVAALLILYLNLRSGEVVSHIVRDVDDEGRVLWVPTSKTEAGKRVLEVAPVLVPLLWALAKDRKPDEPLFGVHWRDWPRKWVQQICRLAGVPLITAHGMRGTHASLATRFGSTSRAVMAAMGHTSEKVTLQSYTDFSALAEAQQHQVLRVL
jgi:integrase